MCRSHPGDRRRQAVNLTPAGRRALGSARDLLRERLEGALEEMNPREAESLAVTLGRRQATLDGWRPPPLGRGHRRRRGSGTAAEVGTSSGWSRGGVDRHRRGDGDRRRHSLAASWQRGC